MYYLLFIVVAIAVIYFTQKPKKKTPETDFSFITEEILEKNIAFYKALGAAERLRFVADMKKFLSTVIITGVDTTVEDLDKIFVAASAVIPLFAFPEWNYNLKEVLIYSDNINESFQSTGEGRNIMGMVGTGYLNGKMLLSKHALQMGFSNKTDKNNTAIHEFVHLIDKMDGDTDGVPELLMQQQYIIPWLDMIHKKMQEMEAGKSDLNPYGATNQAEFFAVASEYFFERPDLLKQKHPELYGMLSKVFKKL